MAQIHRDAILALVDGVPHEHSVHEPVLTSADASRVRGVPLSSGAKALVLRSANDHTILVVIPAHKKLDSKAIKRFLGAEYSFATDPFERVGCVPGSVPPFGSVLGLQTYADESLENVLNFNIGLLTESLKLEKCYYLELEKPIVGVFSKDVSV